MGIHWRIIPTDGECVKQGSKFRIVQRLCQYCSDARVNQHRVLTPEIGWGALLLALWA